MKVVSTMALKKCNINLRWEPPEKRDNRELPMRSPSFRLGGSLAEWSARRTRGNPAVPGSSPALATCWSLGRPEFKSPATLVERALSPPCLTFLAWGDFHARARFARSTIMGENGDYS